MLNKTLLLPTLLLTFLTGCVVTRAHDEGMFLRGKKVAFVKGFGVTLQRVNGVEIGMLSTGAEVLPGKRLVEFSLNESNFTYHGPDHSVYSLNLNAEAGKVYIVTGARGDGRVCAWEQIPETGAPNYTKPAGCVENRPYRSTY